MGNCFKSKRLDSPKEKEDKSTNEAEISKKQSKPKSWETRAKLNKEDYQYINREKETLIKLPGSINGQQFIIEKCINCKIYLFDLTETVFIDDCENCSIFVGPCASSVFVRNCLNINIIVICQQFRISETKKVNAMIYCQTQPTLEQTQDLKLEVFKFGYFNLREQLDRAKLNIWNNVWWDIFDFNELDKKNYDFLSQNISPFDLIGTINEDIAKEIGLITEDFEKHSVLPLSKGIRFKLIDDECILCVFSDFEPENLITPINTHNEIILLRSKQVILNEEHINSLEMINQEFSKNKLNFLSKPTLFIHFTGTNLIENIKKLVLFDPINKDSFILFQKKDNLNKLQSLIFDTWKNEKKINK